MLHRLTLVHQPRSFILSRGVYYAVHAMNEGPLHTAHIRCGRGGSRPGIDQVEAHCQQMSLNSYAIRQDTE